MFDNFFDIITYIITIASVVTATTPTLRPNSFWGKLYKLIEYIAFVNQKTKMSHESHQ